MALELLNWSDTNEVLTKPYCLIYFYKQNKIYYVARNEGFLIQETQLTLILLMNQTINQLILECLTYNQNCVG